MKKYEHITERNPETGAYRTTSVNVKTGFTYIMAESLKVGDVVRHMGCTHTTLDVVRVDGKILVEFRYTFAGISADVLLECAPWKQFLLV